MEWLYAADDYVPGQGFRQDIEYSYHISGEPAPYVPSEYLRPDYTILGRNQMEFYYHFRDCIRNGEYPETDRGYIWLALCEILVAEEDPQRAMSIAHGMLEAYGRMFPCNIIISTFLYDYAISHDMPLPITRFAPGCDINEAMICTQLCGPSFDLPLETLQTIGAYDDRTGRLDPVEYTEYLNRALEELDGESRHIRGFSLLEWYGNSRKEVRYTVFEDFECVGAKESYMIDFPAPFSNESFNMYMEAVSKYCARQLLGANNGAPKVPQYLDQSSRSTLDRVLADMRSDRPRIPIDSRRNPTTIHYRVCDPMAKAKGVYTPAEPEYVGQSYDDDAFVSGPVMLFNTSDRYINPGEHTLNNIRRYLDEESDVPVEYVPAGYNHPDPVTIGDRARSYYVYWRTMCRKGTFLDIDSSYMWMYLTELVNFSKDPRWTLDHLVQLSEVYGDSLNDLIHTTALEYALCHNLPVPRNRMVDDSRWSSLLTYRFLSANPMDDLTLDMFLRCCSKLDPKYLPSPREESRFTEVMNHALRSADMYLRNATGTGVFATIGIKPSTVRRELFTKLYYRGDNRVLHFNYCLLSSSKTFVSLMTGVFRTALMVIRKHEKLSHPRVPTDFDPGLKGFIEDAVKRFLEGRPSGHVIRQAPIVLDSEAVSLAQEDLMTVTELMHVPDEDDEPEVVDTVVEETATGWDALAKTLDEDCRGYLKACMEGNGRRFAKGRGSSVSTLEGRINDSAMDIVEDIIVEDGVVIEDYLDDVRNMLGM